VAFAPRFRDAITFFSCATAALKAGLRLRNSQAQSLRDSGVIAASAGASRKGDIINRPREEMLRPRSMAPSRKRLSKVVAMRAPARSTRSVNPCAENTRRALFRRQCAG
jgi:hypothetical protein